MNIRAWSSGRGLVVGQGRYTAQAAVDSNPVSLPSTTFQLPRPGLITVASTRNNTPTHPSQQVSGSCIIGVSSGNGRQPGFSPCYPRAITHCAPSQDNRRGKRHIEGAYRAVGPVLGRALFKSAQLNRTRAYQGPYEYNGRVHKKKKPRVKS